MECIYRPFGANGVYLPSLRDWWSVFTVPTGLMECIYRPCGVDEVWSVFTVPTGLMECIYRPFGANEVYLPSPRG